MLRLDPDECKTCCIRYAAAREEGVFRPRRQRCVRSQFHLPLNTREARNYYDKIWLSFERLVEERGERVSNFFTLFAKSSNQTSFYLCETWHLCLNVSPIDKGESVPCHFFVRFRSVKRPDSVSLRRLLFCTESLSGLQSSAKAET